MTLDQAVALSLVSTIFPGRTDRAPAAPTTRSCSSAPRRCCRTRPRTVRRARAADAASTRVAVERSAISRRAAGASRLPAGPLVSRRSRRVSTHRPVAIVGSRAATRGGARNRRAASAADLAARGVIVVSGLARGVDSAAHRGALHGRPHGRRARLGPSTDLSAPSTARSRARSPDAALVVSEYPPGTPPLPFHFPLRNRLISGLSRAVVVIEAAEKSGSLITAACALEQGREVMAVPGNVLSGRNRGGHALIRDGAKIVECADDIVAELALARPLRSAGS